MKTSLPAMPAPLPQERWASKALDAVSKTVGVRVGQLAHKICATWLETVSIRRPSGFGLIPV